MGAAVEADQVGTYRRGRVPRPVRLSQVLGLAEELFAERGYTAASMDELARRAGVSKPMVYDLVVSKEELFRACMDRSAEQLAARITAAVRAETDPRARLSAGSRAWFDFIAEQRACGALLGGVDAPAGEQAEQIRARQAQLVATLFGEDATVGGPGPSPLLLDAVAHLVNGAFESLGRWWGEHPDVTSTALADLCTDVLFPGLVALGQRPNPLNLSWL
ncbi:MAG: TetR/AcrR family transcriptional regulator [Acidimicrobiales bacterium]